MFKTPLNLDPKLHQTTGDCALQREQRRRRHQRRRRRAWRRQRRRQRRRVGHRAVGEVVVLPHGARSVGTGDHATCGKDGSGQTIVTLPQPHTKR